MPFNGCDVKPWSLAGICWGSYICHSMMPWKCFSYSCSGKRQTSKIQQHCSNPRWEINQSSQVVMLWPHFLLEDTRHVTLGLCSNQVLCFCTTKVKMLWHITIKFLFLQSILSTTATFAYKLLNAITSFLWGHVIQASSSYMKKTKWLVGVWCTM